MFYNIFCELCLKKGVKPTRAALDIGLSNAAPTKWKKTGAAPTGDTLAKIAAYFDVSADTLLGNDRPPLTYDEFSFAMYEETKNLTEQQKSTLLSMAQFFRHQLEKEGESAGKGE